ncbi:MAG TPA: GNAT family N-acetyltransferase [Acidimicrobiales bacterium]|nr:GNAT family N-acetyltransferase [Acidimicrobiales bacterium]
MSTTPTQDLGQSEPTDYPASWEFDGLLNDGEAVLVRPVLPSDATALAGLRVHAIPGTMSFRSLVTHPALIASEMSHFTTVDYQERMAFVVVAGNRVVALSSFDRVGEGGSVARIEIVVDESFQHRGIATLLFESLAAYAHASGIERFVAEVQASNTSMLNILISTGLRSTSVEHEGTVRIEIDLRPTAKYRQICDAREAIAEVASTSSILRPRTVAVVGAGRTKGSAGHEVVRSILAGDFSGTVYPVNPSARSICGVKAFPTLAAIPEPVDLAIIALPADRVAGVLEEAATKGVRAATIITSGFAETGRSGEQAETEFLRVARRHGMRIVGPNCLGLVNTDPQIRLNATFASLDPLPGRLALVSQSGAVGIVLAEQASAAGLGLSIFVSVGNKLDVSSNDLLCFFERDERTSVIALYLESLGNPRKFARIARRVGAHKPIIALKAGRTSAGVRGARSHTAAAASPDITVTALLQSAGVIKVDHFDELLDVSEILLTGRLPKGRRVALVGNSGGPLVLAADACEAGGLSVPELDDTTKDRLKAALVTAAAVSNPVDLTADGAAADLERSLEIVLDDPGIDAVIVVVTEVVALSTRDARLAIARVAQKYHKPVVACLLGATTERAPSGSSVVGELPSPERAAAALNHVRRYAEWRQNDCLSTEEIGHLANDTKVRTIVATKLANDPDGGWLELEDAADLLEACGVPVVTTRAATSALEAVEVAESIGFPVVLKARSGSLVHKSDVGGVILGLENAEAVSDAYSKMCDRLGADMGGAVLQPMTATGVEAIIGLAVDPDFGPIVMAGLGGVMTDLLGDHSFGVPPFNPGNAETMIRSLRAAALLDGYRGSPKVDRDALIAVLETIAKVAELVPELVELDLNPIVVTANGALVVDCKARLAPGDNGPGPLFRAMRSTIRS